MRTITYFDYTSINYAGFFVAGFTQLAPEQGFRFVITKKLPAVLAALEIDRYWPVQHPVPQIAVFRYQDPVAGEDFFFCIDGDDHNGRDPEHPGYHLPLLELSRYYFKVNYNQEVIDGRADLASHVGKILPARVVFPLQVPQRRPLLPKFTPIGGRVWPREGIRRRLRELRQTPSLDEFRRLRAVERDLDVFYVSIYYGWSKHQEDDEWRLALVKELRQQKHLNTLVGFASYDDELPGEYNDYYIPRMPFDQYLRTLARAKVGLYVRGTVGCLSFKFGHLMALAKPVAGQTLLNNRANMYQLPEFERQFAADDPRELAAALLELLHDQEQMDYLAEVNRRTFEEHLTPKPVVADILSQLLPETAPRPALA